jgi:hypothetical protein
MKKKTILFVSMWLVCMVAVVWGVVTFATDRSRVSINGEQLIALNHEAVKAKVSNPKSHPYLYFKMTKNQQARYTDAISKNGSVAIKVKISLAKQKKVTTDECPFAMGILYEDDFDSENKLKSVINKRSLVTGDLSKISAESFIVSMSFFRNDVMPVGFFIYGTKPYKVANVEFADAMIGWDRSTKVMEFGFTSKGGEIDTAFNTANFTDGELFAHATAGSEKTLFPKIEVGLFPCSDYGTYKEQTRVQSVFGKENILIRRAPNQSSVTIQTASLKQPFCKITLTENAGMVSKMMLLCNEKKLFDSEGQFAQNNEGWPLVPLETDPGFVFDWPQENWRCKDYELYSWEQFPQILFFDTKDYEIQNKLFTRLAYFVEKAGYKGTFVSDSFIETEHGYNAHDYKADDLAKFFSTAYAEDINLNQYELLLKDILVYNNIIIDNTDGSYRAGVGGVISISRESADYLRNTFIAHESWHGIYFIDEQFRTTVAASYEMFDSTAMEFIRTFWATQNGLHYDLSDDYLMKNEFMAYLMQQPCAYTKTYFLQVAGRGSVNQIEPKLAKYVRDTEASAFVDGAELLNDYVFTRWGLSAGRVSLIIRR